METDDMVYFLYTDQQGSLRRHPILLLDHHLVRIQHFGRPLQPVHYARADVPQELELWIETPQGRPLHRLPILGRNALRPRLQHRAQDRQGRAVQVA